MTKDDNTLWTENSIFGVPIRLTTERWEHIIVNHPEMRELCDRVRETLLNPDLIQQDDRTGGLLALRFYSEPDSLKSFLIVVYFELSSYDGFITTAYLRKKPSSRKRIIWTT